LIMACFFALSAMGQLEENDEIRQMNQKIQSKKDEIKKIQEKQAEYAQKIQETQTEQASLNNELAILGNRLAKAQLDIDSTEIDIDRVNLEIIKTDSEIREKNDEIDKEKSQISSALKLIYKQDSTGTLEILLLNNSLTEFLNQAKYLEDINKEIGESLDHLKILKDNLEKEKENLDKQHEELAKLKVDLEEKRKELDVEMENKDYIIKQTALSEREYQRLLARAKQEQLSASSEISSLEKTVRAKLTELERLNNIDLSDASLIWPVPKNTITAYFHDPEYPFRYIFEHPAIDIRAGQATPVKAAASGYVARAKNGGKGYSYIMLVHGDGLSTVYGHVSKILVKEDEMVVQGQIIGLSGGMPGTPGAGNLTTGPHMHFEVRSSGIPANPLDYLP